ncbi:sensor histidine kinase [Bordetella genomosp. 9]|nr:HAMP domain-containing sensor histidine kinase [Bordetella genomosp. 9]
MRLDAFIEAEMQAIVEEAVAFARTIASLTEEDEAEVRNHIPKILENIARDLRTAQSEAASIAKSRGEAAARLGTDADIHGLQRAKIGLSIAQVLAEYRALRSSVLRLWLEKCTPDEDSIRDVGRFNEAIDEAISESVRAFVTETENRRQLFLAALGHDLRGPLHAITLATNAIAIAGQQKSAKLIDVLKKGTSRIAELLDSLLDFNLIGLGGRMTLNKATADLQQHCEEELYLSRAASPGVSIEFVASGNCEGEFDASRMREALGNLLSNAIKHGIACQPILVELRGTPDAIHLTVSNAIDGTIPASELALLFEPMRRRAGKSQSNERSHLGLGLFITKEIAKAHGGDVTATCDRNQISFTLSIPRAE